MENLVNLDLNSVLNWLDVDTSNSNWTKYVNKIENVSLKWDNLNITVITKRAFKDYIYWYLFFLLRCIAVFLIPLYIISLLWLNFAGSFGSIKDNIVNSAWSSLNINMDSIPVLWQASAVGDYMWLMDELLNN